MAVADRLHRLIAVGDLAAEVAADWVASQAIPAGVLAADPGGLYEQPEQRGYALLALWLNGSTYVDGGVAEIGVRPCVTWNIGGTQRVAWDDDEALKPAGCVVWYESPYSRPTWLKITTAPATPGGATHLALYVSEVRQ